MEDISSDIWSLILHHLPINKMCSFLLVSSKFSWLTSKDKLLPLLQHGVSNREISTLTIPQAIYLCRHPHVPRRIVATHQLVWLLRRGELHNLSIMGYYPGIKRSCPSLCEIVEFTINPFLYLLDSEGEVYRFDGTTANSITLPHPVVQIFGQEGHPIIVLDRQGCIRVGPRFSSILPNLPYISCIVDRHITQDDLVWFIDVNGGYHSYNINYETVQSGGVPDHHQKTIITYRGEIDNIGRYEHHDLHIDPNNNLWAISENGDKCLLFTDVEEFCSSGKCLGVITSDGTYLVDYLPPRGKPRKLLEYIPQKIDFSFH